MASNLPLAGRKHQLLEGGMRSSAFIHGAGIQSPGRVSRSLVHVSDWYFTLTEAAARGIGDSESNSSESRWARAVTGRASPGNVPEVSSVGPLQQPAFSPGDGEDVWDAVSRPGVPSPREGIIHLSLPKGYPNWEGEIHSQGQEQGQDPPGLEGLCGAIRQGKWKLLLGACEFTTNTTWIATPGLPLQSDNYTVDCGGPLPGTPCDPGAGAGCLYDMEGDPCERESVAAQQPQLVANLTAELAKYQLQAIPNRSKGPGNCVPTAANNHTWLPCDGTPPALLVGGL